MNWINVKDRLPNEQEIENNYKFLVCNNEDDWTDAAHIHKMRSFVEWYNDDNCTVIPTHWGFMPVPPKKAKDDTVTVH